MAPFPSLPRSELRGNESSTYQTRRKLRWLLVSVSFSPNSITPTLWQSRGHKSWKSATQITSPIFVICVRDSVANLSRTLSPTFPVHCNGLNSIRVTQMSLLQTCHGLCRKHLDMSRWFVSATFVICVSNFHDLCPRLYPMRKFRWKSV